MEKESTKIKTNNQVAQTLHQGEVLIGCIQGVDDQKQPEVIFTIDGKVHTCTALTTIPVTMEQLGRNVVLSFIEGDFRQPVIMGLLWQAENQTPNAKSTPVFEGFPDIEMIKAKDQIQLKCGAASITLTKAGKVLVKGKYISSRSSGVQRIRGGSVQIN